MIPTPLSPPFRLIYGLENTQFLEKALDENRTSSGILKEAADTGVANSSREAASDL